jgi:hypothetical protein
VVVSTAVTVAVLVVVFAGVLPKVAGYSEAWSSIRRLPAGYLVALVVATAVNLAVYVWPLQAAVGILATGVAVAAFAVVLGSERGARTVGGWADRLARPLARRPVHGRPLT